MGAVGWACQLVRDIGGDCLVIRVRAPSAGAFQCGLHLHRIELLDSEAEMLQLREPHLAEARLQMDAGQRIVAYQVVGRNWNAYGGADVMPPSSGLRCPPRGSSSLFSRPRALSRASKSTLFNLRRLFDLG